MTQRRDLRAQAHARARAPRAAARQRRRVRPQQLPRRSARSGGHRVVRCRGGGRSRARGDEQGGTGAERLAKPRNARLQRRCARLGRLAGPQLLQQAVRRDDLVRVEEQEREQVSLARAGQRHEAVTVENLERAEDPEIQLAPPGAFAGCQWAVRALIHCHSQRSSTTDDRGREGVSSVSHGHTHCTGSCHGRRRGVRRRGGHRTQSRDDCRPARGQHAPR